MTKMFPNGSGVFYEICRLQAALDTDAGFGIEPTVFFVLPQVKDTQIVSTAVANPSCSITGSLARQLLVERVR